MPKFYDGPSDFLLPPGGGYLARKLGGSNHSSLTFNDPFTGTVQHANTPAEQQAYLDMRKRQEFRKKLNAYDTEAMKFRNNLTQDFRTTSEYAGAQQVGGVNAQTGLYAQRMGIEGPAAASINADAQRQLRSQVLGSQLSFEQKLGQLMYGERMGFVRGEFDYMNRLQAMNYGNELSKDSARFQANLASDLTSRDLLGGLVELGGYALGGGFGGGGGGGSSYSGAPADSGYGGSGYRNYP